ncbi:MAG TPA: DUF494 domain-containing protein [Gammaproteobacteria bacterium]|nr:DUF494 domain-containing protein [Gammaproteobacteria bacterium]
MKETELDVLMFLFDNYLGVEVEFSGGENAIADELKQAGFHEQDINKAFDWLSTLSDLYQDGYELPEHSRALRVLSTQECAKLDVKAQGYLWQLEGQGVLDPTTREIILESAMAIDVQTLNLQQFKRIVALVLLNNPKAEAIVASGEDLVYQEIGGIFH